MGKGREAAPRVTLVPYYPNERAALPWYQDAALCRQVDNRDTPYDLALLRQMYRYLKGQGQLFYIKCAGRLCGDICLQRSGEINIVVAAAYQNRRIGTQAVEQVVDMAKKQGMPLVYADIFSFNARSIRMFHSLGFTERKGAAAPDQVRLIRPLEKE